MADGPRLESMRTTLATATDAINSLITDDTTTAEGSYLMASVQASALGAIALGLADLTDVLAEIRDEMRKS